MGRFLVVALVVISIFQGCAKGSVTDTSGINSNMPGAIAADAQ